ncbi:MAG: hypothetical protein M5U11_03595 [Anaerolineales bacterium]|jgi:hypothetical protein|nr:hypothetical protein [Anaerolineales bacterium]GER78398.1 conserved hypothetical protein [Candidatus Denitrolinea symbiosum]MBW7919186.1 hypothetical protein [Anaerolineales bacterium]MCZ2287639.1 hypothetical protein [Anaerolineales bacterium]MCZ7548221.1 hypothetical protein [Anaerolineales bacterium]
MKIQKFMLTGFVITILALVIFASAYDGGKAKSFALAKDLYGDLPTPTLYPTSLPGISARVLQKIASTEIQTVSANGIEMSAANFRLENNEVKVDICFQTPNNNDWISDASLQIGNEKVPAYGGTTFEKMETLEDGQKRITTYLGNPPKLNWSMSPSDGQPDYRCDTLAFRLGDAAFPAQVVLQIRSIVSTPNEGEGCAEYRDMVQSILNARSDGIKVDCSQNDFEFGARTRFTIVEKPVSMSQEQAEQLVSKIFYESFTINGPWIFTQTLNR